jgi:hypothetical protein
MMGLHFVRLADTKAFDEQWRSFMRIISTSLLVTPNYLFTQPVKRAHYVSDVSSRAYSIMNVPV